MTFQVIGPYHPQHVLIEKISKFHLKHEFDNALYFTVFKDRVVAGSVVIYAMTPQFATVSFFGTPGFLTRRFINFVSQYVFEYLKLTRLECRIFSDNKKSIDIVERLGFVREGRLRQVWDKRDMYVYSILPGECRFVRSAK